MHPSRAPRQPRSAPTLVAFGCAVLLVLLVALSVAGCGAGGVSSASTTRATPSSTAGANAAGSPSSAGSCPAADMGYADTSTSIIGGTVLLPPSTRVIVVDSVPGAADATLCTTSMSAAQIDQFMQAHLPSSGWHFDSASGRWKNGDALTFTYSVPDPLDWTVECVCGGI